MSDDIIKAARKVLGTSPRNAILGTRETILEAAQKVLEQKIGLDAYLTFDTSPSMEPYRYVVKDQIGQVTTELLKAEEDIRVSINGIGDHDGRDMLQMYPLTSKASKLQRSIDGIVNTYGRDEPEAYECLALAMAQRIPVESIGRKRAVILIADSIPHGMVDAECTQAGSYQRAFRAMSAVCDAFYLVGCRSSMYPLQQQLLDPSKPEREQLIPLGEMGGILPQLLIALVKKTYSSKMLQDYLHRLELENPPGAQKIKGLLGF
ncbi:MAG: hypothetical protein Q7K45_02925 [Nanoarchaeota archaeon]|nr:hypothetical protein [Nanoarchaeota archaeon]